MVDKTDASVMKKVRKILKENDEEIKRANEAFFHSKESIIDHIYVDLAAIKDTRMGLLLSLCKSPEEMAYLTDHLIRYNNRAKRSFVSEAYPEFSYSEEHLRKLYYSLSNDAPEFSELIFNKSPDTVAFLFLLSFINICDQNNGIEEKSTPINLTINCWPLQKTNIVKYYEYLLSCYFEDRVHVTMISQKPNTIPSANLLTNQVFFFDSLKDMSAKDSTVYYDLFKYGNFFSKRIYAPYEVEDDRYDKWVEDGFSIDDEEQFVSRFEVTNWYMNLCSHFSYFAYDIPLPSHDTKESSKDKNQNLKSSGDKTAK